jgi:broad specificity phosphatase PhoE
MKILLVKHAESVGNKQGIYQGQSYDTDLTEIGQKQVREIAKYLGNSLVGRIISSPAGRCVKTVEGLSKTVDVEIEKEPLLMEINHGQWEGKTREEVEKLFADQLKLWQEKPGEVIMPSGESLIDVSSRIQKWFEKLDGMADEIQNNLVVSTHDAVIRTILVKILRRELDDIRMFDIDSGGITTLEWGKMPQVVEINSTGYLDELKSNS